MSTQNNTNPLQTHTEWYHTRTNNRYKIVGLPRVKIENEWVNGVLYETVEGEFKQFVRTHTDFLNSFSFVRFL